MATMLIISRYCAFAKAPYAGSHTHRYYLTHLRRDFDVTVVTVAEPADAPCGEFAKSGINADVIYVDEHPRRALDQADREPEQRPAGAMRRELQGRVPGPVPAPPGSGPDA